MSTPSKIPLDEVLATLRDHIQDKTLLRSIEIDLAKVQQELEAAKEPPSKAGKTRLVAFIRSTPETAKALETAVGGGAFIISVPSGESEEDNSSEGAVMANTYMGSALIQRLQKAAAEHNEAPKGKRRGKARSKVETWLQLFTQVRAKTFKTSGSSITVKGKGVPIEVLILSSETVQPGGAS